MTHESRLTTRISRLQEVRRVPALRTIVRDARQRGKSIGLVPTMGYLHEGHVRLMAEARRENELVIVSIFVNPTQFGPHEDFDRYPRDIERDRQLARQHGVDVLFVPDGATMYPGGAADQGVWVDPGRLAEHLCGASRPVHFRGVATVVAKLFNMAQPDRAYFGQKDGQQLVIVQRLVRDLAFPVEIRAVPTVREGDGLAISSRNVFLSEEEREQAGTLFRSLQLAQSAFEAGEGDADRLETMVREIISRDAPLARVDYVTVADLDTIQPIRGQVAGPALLALAAYFGPTRLIDNVILGTAS